MAKAPMKPAAKSAAKPASKTAAAPKKGTLPPALAKYMAKKKGAK